MWYPEKAGDHGIPGVPPRKLGYPEWTMFSPKGPCHAEGWAAARRVGCVIQKWLKLPTENATWYLERAAKHERDVVYLESAAVPRVDRSSIQKRVRYPDCGVPYRGIAAVFRNTAAVSRMVERVVMVVERDMNGW